MQSTTCTLLNLVHVNSVSEVQKPIFGIGFLKSRRFQLQLKMRHRVRLNLLISISLAIAPAFGQNFSEYRGYLNETYGYPMCSV